MGLPAIQLFMIAARQVSKPIAEALLGYGKNHPQFRNRLLIPMGRSLVHLTTRLRMKRLGLGSPTQIAPVSEATALEQASDFIQQVVLFGYSVGVFAGYYYYTKLTAPEIMKMDDFDKYKEEQEEIQERLRARIKRLEEVLVAARYKLPALPEPATKAKSADDEEEEEVAEENAWKVLTRVVKAAIPISITGNGARKEEGPQPPVTISITGNGAKEEEGPQPPVTISITGNGAKKEGEEGPQPPATVSAVAEPVISTGPQDPQQQQCAAPAAPTVTASSPSPSPTPADTISATQPATVPPAKKPSKHRFPRVSSLPLDTAQRIVLEGGEE